MGVIICDQVSMYYFRFQTLYYQMELLSVQILTNKMKRFQQLITPTRQNKTSDKLSFRGLSRMNSIDHPIKPKINYPSFRELANEMKSNNVPKTNFVKSGQQQQFTLKKDKKQKKNHLEFDGQTLICKKSNKVQNQQNLSGITMIDSVAVEENQPDNKEFCEDHQADISTTQKKQIQKQINEVTMGIKNRLFCESKSANTFRDMLKEVNEVIQIQTQRVYSKILHQRTTSRGHNTTQTLKSNSNIPSCGSITEKRSPLLAKYQSDRVSPFKFESARSTTIKTKKNKSTSKFIKDKIVGGDTIKITQFKFD